MDGFIFVSIGSTISWSGIDSDIKDKLINVLEAIGLRVFWKEEIEIRRNNFIVRNWFPQEKILGKDTLKQSLAN